MIMKSNVCFGIIIGLGTEIHIGHLISNITVWRKIISNIDILGLMILLPNNYFNQCE